LSKPFFLCLPGSARLASSNAVLLRKLAIEMSDFADALVYEGLIDLPIFSPDREGSATPAIINDLKSRVARAHGLIIACPEYVHGIPGGFKNLIDWLVSGDELYGKPVMLVHTNGHGRGAHVRAQLCEVLTTAGVNLFEPDGLTIYLVSKDASEIEKILSDPGNRRDMKLAVQHFASRLVQTSS
jgi:chromate reductase, NAD(P)H dehydrogenase (quinone)